MRPARQEAAGDFVDVDAAGAAGPGEVSLSLQLGEVAPGGAFRDAGLQREACARCGKQRPAWSAKLTRHCIAQRRRGFNGR